MKVFKLKKKSGGYREIHAPNKQEKAAYRQMVEPLQNLAAKLDTYGVSHGFMPGRSAVTNARVHVGDWEYTVSFDLKDFFDSVRVEHFWKLDTADLHELNQIILGNNTLPPKQGLPTSPILANIAFAPVDQAIMEGPPLAGMQGPRVCYSRYADDLTFSCSREGLVDLIIEMMPERIAQHGFTLNEKKTRIQWAKAGRRIITGIAVDSKGMYPTRATRRKLRAARHQNNAAAARGLEEWCKLREPGSWRSIRKAVKEYRSALRVAAKMPSGYYTNRLLRASHYLEIAAYRNNMDPRDVLLRAAEGVTDE